MPHEDASGDDRQMPYEDASGDEGDERSIFSHGAELPPPPSGMPRGTTRSQRSATDPSLTKFETGDIAEGKFRPPQLRHPARLHRAVLLRNRLWKPARLHRARGP